MLNFLEVLTLPVPQGRKTALKFSKVISILSLAGLFLSGCSDPANDVHKSATSEPVNAPDLAASSVSGKQYVIRADESTIGFVGSKVTGKHDGGFKSFEGTIQVADGRIVGNPVVKISMDSIWSDNERLTGHLKSADFFEVETYPISTFTVVSIEPAHGQHQVTGNLEMHGVTKSILFQRHSMRATKLST